jgi:hypothetical protein
VGAYKSIIFQSGVAGVTRYTCNWLRPSSNHSQKSANSFAVFVSNRMAHPLRMRLSDQIQIGGTLAIKIATKKRGES